MPNLHIVILTFESYMERSPEVIGPFDSDDAANAWVDTVVDSGVTDTPSNDLSACTFIVTQTSAPFHPTVLGAPWETLADLVGSGL